MCCLFLDITTIHLIKPCKRLKGLVWPSKVSSGVLSLLTWILHSDWTVCSLDCANSLSNWTCCLREACTSFWAELSSLLTNNWMDPSLLKMWLHCGHSCILLWNHKVSAYVRTELFNEKHGTEEQLSPVIVFLTLITASSSSLWLFSFSSLSFNFEQI